MPDEILHVHAITYESHPNDSGAELDMAVTFALAGRAAVLGELTDDLISFRRRRNGGVQLEVVETGDLADPVRDYCELLSLAESSRSIEYYRNWETSIARVCKLTARLELEGKFEELFARYRGVLARRGVDTVERFKANVEPWLDADLEEMGTRDGWRELVTRLAGPLLVRDDLGDVRSLVGNLAKGLENSHYMWNRRTNAEIFYNLFVTSS